MASIEDDLQNLKLRLEMMESEKKSVENEHKVITKQHDKQVEKFKQTNLALKQLIYESRKNAIKGIQYEDEVNGRKKQDLLNYKIQMGKHQNIELQKEKTVLQRISRQSDKDTEFDIEKLKQKTTLAIIKSQEADVLRKNFEKLLATFQDDRNTFDIRMRKLEEALEKKRIELGDVELNFSDSSQSRELWRRNAETNETDIENQRKTREEAINEKKDDLHSLTVVDDENNLLIEKSEEDLEVKSEAKAEEDEDIILYRNQRIEELSTISSSIKKDLLVESVVDLKRLVKKNENQVRILNHILDDLKEKVYLEAPSLESSMSTSVIVELDVAAKIDNADTFKPGLELESELLRFRRITYRKGEKLQSSKQKLVPDFCFDVNSKHLEEKLAQLVVFFPKKELELEIDIMALSALLPSQNQRIQFKEKLYTPFLPIQQDDLFIPTRDFLKKQSILLASQSKQKTTKRRK